MSEQIHKQTNKQINVRIYLPGLYTIGLFLYIEEILIFPPSTEVYVPTIIKVIYLKSCVRKAFLICRTPGWLNCRTLSEPLVVIWATKLLCKQHNLSFMKDSVFLYLFINFLWFCVRKLVILDYENALSI